MGDIILKLKMLWIYRGGFRDWYRDVWCREAGERQCCDGHECGCYGSCHGDWWEYLWNSRKERRP